MNFINLSTTSCIPYYYYTTSCISCNPKVIHTRLPRLARLQRMHFGQAKHGGQGPQ